MRSGTQNAGLISGFHAAAEHVLGNREERATMVETLRTRFLELLSEKGLSRVHLNSVAGKCVPHILSLSVPGAPSGPLAKLLEERGCLVATGSACGSHKAEPDPVLAAMGLRSELQSSAIRISFSAQNTLEEVSILANAFTIIRAADQPTARRKDPMNERAVLLRYHEIALKGFNRGWFEERLAINARKLIARAFNTPERKLEFTQLHSRLILHCDWNPSVREALGRLFGLASFSPAVAVRTDLDEITQVAIREFASYLAENPLPKSFRVFTRRSDKAVPETSMQVDRKVGTAVGERFPGMEVNLDHPEFTIGVEIRREKSYVWMDKVTGPGGLPVGTDG